MKKVGMDNGNYALKLWVEGNKDAIQVPTVISLYTGEVTDLFEQEDIPKEELLNNIDVTINSKALHRNNERYIVGNKVINDDLPSEELENHSDKSTDEITAILGLSGLAINEIYNNYEENKIESDFDISLSLPVNTINLEKATKYANRFIGQHEIIFHHPSGRDQTVIINIKFARTLPEGSAGAWGIIYNEDGSSKKYTIIDNGGKVQKTLEGDVLLHFDIGAGTTEEVVTNGVAYQPKRSRGHDFGVKSTIEDIRGQWNSNSRPNEKIDSVAEFNNIYFDKENPRHTDLVILSKPHLRQLARKMTKLIINKIDELKTKPVTFIYGGGSTILEEYIIEELKTKDRMDRVMFLNDPINVTAKGLLVYTASPRYQYLKEIEVGEKQNG